MKYNYQIPLGTSIEDEFCEGDFGFKYDGTKELLPKMELATPILYNTVGFNKIKYLESRGYKLVHFRKSKPFHFKELLSMKGCPTRSIGLKEIKSIRSFIGALITQSILSMSQSTSRKCIKVIHPRYNIKKQYVVYTLFEFRKFKEFKHKKPPRNFLAKFFKYASTFQFGKSSIFKPSSFRQSIGLKVRLKIFRRDNYTCQYCGHKNGNSGELDRVLHIDHIIPVSRGGTNKFDNLLTSCMRCNIKKNDKFLPEIIEKWTWNPKHNFKYENIIQIKENVDDDAKDYANEKTEVKQKWEIKNGNKSWKWVYK